MSLSDCPKCWDTPCTCGGNDWDRPNYRGMFRVHGDGSPGSPSSRLQHLFDELAKRFPEAEQPYSSQAPEPRYLKAIDKLLKKEKT